MSQFFDQASLVMVPSGYKDGKLYSQKPLSSSGELTFSRGSDIEATRVAANGFIQKAKVNLVLQSNTFSNAAWTKYGSLTVTGGQAGYDGTNNAWLLTKPAAGFTGLGQAHANTGVITGSFYLKAGTLTKATVRLIGTPDVNVIFDLSAGTVFGGTASGWLARTITSVGNGWYRCSLALNATASSVFIVYPDEITNTTAGTIFAQSAQLEVGNIATDYIATTTAAVSVGPVSGLPRLDYSGGATCPSLLLEPQRTNYIPQSEPFNGGDWLSSGSAAIISNAALSPQGVQNAAEVQGPSGSSFIYDVLNITASTAHTTSFYIKNNNATRTQFFAANESTYSINWDGLTIDSVDSGVNYESVGNDWYRVWASQNSNSDGQFITRFYPSNAGASIYLYGYQVEQGSYPTSYIPTTELRLRAWLTLLMVLGLHQPLTIVKGCYLLKCHLYKTEG